MVADEADSGGDWGRRQSLWVIFFSVSSQVFEYLFFKIGLILPKIRERRNFGNLGFRFWAECRSAMFEMGNTKVIAAVYGPREVFISMPFLFCWEFASKSILIDFPINHS